MTTKAQSLAGYPVHHIVSSKVVANNTFEILARWGDRVIRLHFTDIMVFRPDGSIMLDSGGWQTVTTKARMNTFLPAGLGIYQDKGIWYLSHRPDGFVDYDSGAWNIPYYDGIVIPADRSIPTSGGNEQREKRLKLINKMCRKADNMAKENQLPRPESGDCLLCVFEAGEDFRSGKGNPQRGNDHILSHLEEQYLHGSLIYNAYLWAGYRTEQMGFVYGMRVGQILRRYLKARVGMAQ